MGLTGSGRPISEYGAIESVHDSSTKALSRFTEDSCGLSLFIKCKIKGVALFSAAVLAKFIFGLVVVEILGVPQNDQFFVHYFDYGKLVIVLFRAPEGAESHSDHNVRLGLEGVGVRRLRWEGTLCFNVGRIFFGHHMYTEIELLHTLVTVFIKFIRN